MLEFFKNQRKANLFLISLVTIAGIALLDARISRDLSLSLFYLLPVFLTAWYLGRAAGVAMILLTAGLWTLSDVVSSNTTLITLLWNLLIRSRLFVRFYLPLAAYAEKGLRARSGALAHRSR